MLRHIRRRNFMYVCICNPVSDKAVRRAIGEGACSVSDLRERLGVAANCCRCVPELRAMLAAADLPKASPVLPIPLSQLPSPA
jgi:bacterioferritin-associated ferredoxin